MENIFKLGEENITYSEFFTGKSYINYLTNERLVSYNVTFEPGCRNNWHIHHKGGQVLYCIEGQGLFQESGKKAVSLSPGDVVNIPPGVKHWHGAKNDSWFAHVAIEVPAVDGHVEWLEPVTDEEYEAVNKIIGSFL